ncbi:glycoside hydrolase family 5 protein [Methylobacterium sp. CM6247]
MERGICMTPFGVWGDYPGQWPNEGVVPYYGACGFRLFRCALDWERFQPELNGPLDLTYMSRLTRFVQAVTKAGGTAILDVHNYMRRDGKIIGQSDVTVGHLIEFWLKLAKPFADNRQVWFGLMNEPHDVDSYNLARSLGALAEALRRAYGDNNAILIPGNDWCCGERWLKSGNDVLHDRIPPINNSIVEVHQYLDDWGSGASPYRPAQVGSSKRLATVTAWAAKTGRRLLLGETACGLDVPSLGEMRSMLALMSASPVWVGYCWWSSLGFCADPSRRWYNLDPVDGQDAPQMAFLRG